MVNMEDLLFNQTNTDISETGDAGMGKRTLASVLLPVNCVVILLNLLGNSATIAAFVKVRTLREKNSDWLILSLSVADLGVGLTQLMYLPFSLSRWPWGKFGCQLHMLVGKTCVVSGLYTTVCIGFDRYLLISRSYPVYVKMQCKTRMCFYIVVIFTYAILTGIIELILWDIVEVPGLGRDPFDYTRNCRSPPKHTPLYSFIVFAINAFNPILMLEIFSVMFVIMLRRYLKRTARVGNNHDLTTQAIRRANNRREPNPEPGLANNRVNNNNNLETEEGVHVRFNPSRMRYTKAAATLFALVITVNIFVLPYVVYVIIANSFCRACNNDIIREVLIHGFFFNSSLNPYMYAATMPKIRNYYKRMIFKAFRNLGLHD